MRVVDEAVYIAAAQELAAARVRYSREWQLQRNKGGTDMMATQAAIEITRDEITVLEAKLIVAGKKL